MKLEWHDILILSTGVIVIIFLIRELISGWSRAPFIPSSRASIRSVLQHITFPPQALVVDLGAGDGRFLRAVRRAYPHATVKGFELSWTAYMVTHVVNLFSRYPVRTVLQDMLTADIRNVDVVFCFLLPRDLVKLQRKLQTELPPHAIVISNTFSFSDWQPRTTLSVQQTGLSGHIRVYAVADLKHT